MKISDMIITRPVSIIEYYRTYEVLFIFDDYVWALEDVPYKKELNKYNSIDEFRKVVTGLNKEEFDLMYTEESQDILEQVQEQNPNIRNILVADL